MSIFKKKNSEKFRMIQTKLPSDDYEKLSEISEGFNMTKYEILQAVVMGLVRYFDKGSIISYDGKNLINAIGNVIFSTKGSFNPVSLKGRFQQNVSSAILFLKRGKGKREQLIEVHTDAEGIIIESYNYDTMLSAFLGCIDPDALQHLEYETKRLGYFSITHTLHELILQRTASMEDNIASDVAELFSDIRIPTGETVNEDVYYKRKFNIGDDYTTITKRKENYRADI